MKKILFSLSLVIATVVYTSSCTKIRTTELGGELIPSVDNVNVFDTTLEVISELYQLPDSSRITRSADHAFGIMEDPAFGKTAGEFYFQAHPQIFGVYPFGSSRDSIIALDSVILSLRYKSVYGDSNAVQNLKVYEIDQQATDFKDSIGGYLVSHPAFQTASQIGEKNNVLFSSLNDSIMYIRAKDTIKTSNELRIVLPVSFGQRLMNFDTTIYKTDSAFNANFKGFAIKPDEGSAIKKALAYFNLADAGTKLSFHYRRIKNAKPDTLVTDFTFQIRSQVNPVQSANANLVTRNPNGSAYSNALANGSANQEKLYLQSSPGSYALLKIPGLAGISNRLIYRAALTTEKLDEQGDNDFAVPGLLFLDAVDSANNRFITVPHSFEPIPNSAVGYNPAIFGGFLHNGKFEFELSRYVQGIVTSNEKSFALRLYAPYKTSPVIPGYVTPPVLTINPPISSGRVVVSGGANPQKRMRLYIVYSKI